MSLGTYAAQQPVILIVQDRAVLRAPLRESVQRLFPEHTILDAHNGARGMALCMAHRPALVLMDVELPDANGIELTACIIAAAPYIPIILLSFATDQACINLALRAGARALVAKDRLVAELIPAMMSVLKPDDPDLERLPGSRDG